MQFKQIRKSTFKQAFIKSPPKSAPRQKNSKKNICQKC